LMTLSDKKKVATIYMKNKMPIIEKICILKIQRYHTF
jgi:hypothetical protein